MKKSILTLMLMVAMLPLMANAFEQLADGVYQDGSTLYISSGVTSLGNLQVNPTTIYCYATIPPACSANTFTGYGAALHVPTSAMVNYFSAQYWYNFNNVMADAVEPTSLTLNHDSVTIVIGDQFHISASVIPTNYTPNTISWYSTNTSVATVAGGTVTTVSPGECDIFAHCATLQVICHVTVTSARVTIILDKHEAKVLPNHMLTLIATCSPMPTDLTVMSSDNTIAMPRLINGSIQVLGLKEGTATITVGSVDGTANTDACAITVYTEIGDTNRDGYVNISDVTSLIDYLLNGDDNSINLLNADCNKDGKVNIADVTKIIDYLLEGQISWDEEHFTVNGVSFTMIPIEGGTFTMGSNINGSWSNAYPEHIVTLSDYKIGQTEVTQELWVAIMGNNPSHFRGDLKHPVERVTWDDCQLFINKLNELTGRHFKLPSEAQWEFAARGGNLSESYTYSGSNILNDVAWYKDNSNNTTHPVATKAPNELGLYDMSGNVQEWCQDWCGYYYNGDYPYGSQIDPTGPPSATDRVRRNGGYDAYPQWCTVWSREDYYQIVRYNLGFRIAL